MVPRSPVLFPPWPPRSSCTMFQLASPFIAWIVRNPRTSPPTPPLPIIPDGALADPPSPAAPPMRLETKFMDQTADVTERSVSTAAAPPPFPPFPPLLVGAEDPPPLPPRPAVTPVIVLNEMVADGTPKVTMPPAEPPSPPCPPFPVALAAPFPPRPPTSRVIILLSMVAVVVPFTRIPTPYPPSVPRDPAAASVRPCDAMTSRMVFDEIE